ncbi:MAG: hypothetical protein M1832_004845 [Thelocarpon impressellum]|nr:MAG: hypothetical protein M1832_004845 [Thelocarpon impressellum]
MKPKTSMVLDPASGPPKVPLESASSVPGPEPVDGLAPGKDALQELRSIEHLAKSLVDASEQKATETPPNDRDTPNKALLSLDEPTPRPSQARSQPPKKPSKRDVDALSSRAHAILLDPSVFISPAILVSYVQIQCALDRPQTLPLAFELYATKPPPGRRPTFTPRPNRVQNAIPLPLASSALDSAIASKDLALALSVIDTTVATPAFRRAKTLYRALPLLMGAALTPAAMYALATQLSTYQSAMDGQAATNVAFAGLLAYVAFSGTIGVVAVTTANDQMERVTWAPGTPLRSRWLREPERAALDRVAVAWGFRSRERRGEEEGEDWEALREWVGRRGMVLDATALMDGME